MAIWSPCFPFTCSGRDAAVSIALPAMRAGSAFRYLLVGLSLRFAGTYFYFEWLCGDRPIALLGRVRPLGRRPSGLALVVAGNRFSRYSWCPFRFSSRSLSPLPLQRVATIASTYALQTFGFIAIAEGNTIRMGDVRLDVVEACSGLSMLLIFFALSTAVAIVIRRPWYEKATIFLSAIPIALVVNIIRITVTGVLHKTVSHEMADRVFHDLAGWLMMPLALAFVWLEMRLFAWLVKDPPKQKDPKFLFGVSRPAANVPVAKVGSQPAGSKH